MRQLVLLGIEGIFDAGPWSLDRGVAIGPSVTDGLIVRLLRGFLVVLRGWETVLCFELFMLVFFLKERSKEEKSEMKTKITRRLQER
jgi:hypothetical protein